MHRKRILVLANSIKRGGRCVAGREVRSSEDGLVLRDWVRPISDHGEGELDFRETTLSSRRQVDVLDYVEVSAVGRADNPCQPENWLIARQPCWADINRAYEPYPLSKLQEHPLHLWLEPGSKKNDRVSDEYLCDHPPPQSLYIIRPQGLRIRLHTTSWNKQRRRARFRYLGLSYDLALTDPVIQDKYGWKIPARGETPSEFALPCGDKCLICVSLASEFEGDHYKVVATVFEDVP